MGRRQHTSLHGALLLFTLYELLKFAAVGFGEGGGVDVQVGVDVEGHCLCGL